MEDSIVKIDIVGGFLGAGKTTFINKLFADGLAAERVVLIENEFGREAIDDATIEAEGFQMRTLASGCICCTLKVDFITAIADIVQTCKPDRILIEPTGIAGPNELESTCNMAATFKGLSVPVRVNSMTTIVDATDVAEMLEYEIPVYMSQIEQAHLVVFSHTQELDSHEIEQAREAVLRAAGSEVTIIDEPWSDIDGLHVLALSEQLYAAGIDGVNGEGGEGRHHHGHHGFNSTVLVPRRPFDDDAIQGLCALLDGQGILRAKGFLPSPEGEMLHFEYVNGRSSVTGTSYPGPAKLVVIGREFDESALAPIESL